MQVRVDILRRPGIADPEGTTVLRALRDLGYDEVDEVHFGRTILLEVKDGDPAAVEARAQEMCEKLLANTVIEDFAVDIL